LLQDETTDGTFRELRFGAREGAMYKSFYTDWVKGPRLVVTPDVTPPTIECVAPDGLWHSANVSLACTAHDVGSGLADPADGSFILQTSVLAGDENANAFTNGRHVCDKAGNCVFVDPIGGNKVDMRPPFVSITVPWYSQFTVGQAATAGYTCVDGGSGVAVCAGPVADGAPINTSSAGTFPFVVTGIDHVGNTATASTTYTSSYGLCLLYDPSKPKKSGSTMPIKLQLCDASGRNLSSSAIVVNAIRVSLVSDTISGPPEDAGNANPDGNFRFDPSLGGYVFNLKTTGLPTGTYELSFTAGTDPVVHNTLFQIR
jgi:hypothetical protein